MNLAQYPPINLKKFHLYMSPKCFKKKEKENNFSLSQLCEIISRKKEPKLIIINIYIFFTVSQVRHFVSFVRTPSNNSFTKVSGGGSFEFELVEEEEGVL